MSMIGNTPGVSSQRTVLETVVSGSPQTNFIPQGGYVVGYVDVLVNGHELDSSDFTAADGINIDLAVAAAVGDTVKVKAWLPRGLSDGYTKAESDARFLKLVGGTLTGDLILGSAASGAASQLALGGYNASGGTGYHGFLSLKNTYGSATNPNKYFRLASNGTLQIINSAYSATIFSLSDSGVLSNVTMDASVLNAGTLDVARIADGSLAFAKLASGDWSRSLGTNGYQKLPSGLIFQWGQAAVGGNSTALVTMSVTFPNAVFITLARHGSGGYAQSYDQWSTDGGVWPANTSQLYIANDDNVTITYYWFAIGW